MESWVGYTSVKKIYRCKFDTVRKRERKGDGTYKYSIRVLKKGGKDKEDEECVERGYWDRMRGLQIETGIVQGKESKKKRVR